MKRITRTIKATRVVFMTTENNEVVKRMEVLPFGAKSAGEIRKVLDVKYPDGVIISSWSVEENKYEMTVETFLRNATLLRNENEDEEEEN